MNPHIITKSIDQVGSRRYRRWLCWALLIAAMVVALAYTSQQTLSFLLTSPEPTLGTFRIQVTEEASDPPPTEWPKLWLDEPVVDGCRVPFQSANVSAGWIEVPKYGIELPVSLDYVDSPNGSSISFAGKSFVMVGTARAWSGIVKVQFDNRPAQVIHVHVPSGQESPVVLEGPPAPESTVFLIGALVVFGGLAVGIAPWRTDVRAGVWLLCFLVAINTLCWLSLPVATTNDSRPYLNEFHDNLAGSPGYFAPGYPTFLGILNLFITANLGRWIAFSQHALIILAAYWMYLLAKRILLIEFAIIIGALVGVLSPVIEMPQHVMSEAPTTFAITGAIYFCVRSIEAGKIRFAALSGLLVGWACLLRVVPLFALVPTIAIFAFLSRDRFKWRSMLVAYGAASIVIISPILWFGYKTGQPALTTATGVHLYTRIVYEQKLLDRDGPATQNLLALLNGDDPTQLQWWTVLDRYRFSNQYINWNDFTGRLKRVSIEAIRSQPLAFISYIPGLAWRLFYGEQGTDGSLGGDTLIPDAMLGSPPLLRVTASAVRWRHQLELLHHLLWPVLCWAAVLGLFVGLLLYELRFVLLFACVPVCYLLACATVTWFYTRYRVPVIPFVVALSVIPISAIFADWMAVFADVKCRFATLVARSSRLFQRRSSPGRVSDILIGSDVRRFEYLRDLLRELVVRDVKLRYNRSILGVLWSLVVPLAELGILYFVFSEVLPLNIPHFTSYLFCGLLPWTWFSSSLLAATIATRHNKDLLQQVGFPAGILPAISILSQFIHFLLALPILFIFLWADGCPVTLAVTALPAIMALQFMFTLGLAYFLAPLEALFHDTQHVLSLALSLLFYMSPIFYQPASIPSRFLVVYNLNPLVSLLGAYRSVLIDGKLPSEGPLLLVGALAGFLVVVGYRFYMHLHYRMIQEC